MGSVYLAKDLEIDRFVAIKLLRSGLDDSLRERFRREARAIGQLHHINIVMVFDVGEHNGSPFFAMEYIEGQTLQQIVRAGKDIALASALHWMEGLCAGLYYAHRRGIVHRDIKPANLVIDDENRLKILDFGIARGHAPGMTQAGMLIGTPNYMSPEQIAGKPIDHRSDTFAVGAVFYEVLTGKQAFPGDIRSGILQRILMSQHQPIREVAPEIDERVVAIVERCLGRDPEMRYPDLEAMRKDVAAVASRIDTTPDASGEVTRLVSATTIRARVPDDPIRAELLRQRRERIDQHIARARAALSARDLALAADACTQALILDPELGEAFELQESIHRLQEAKRWLDEAQQELSRGAVTVATVLIDRASVIDADLPEITRLRDQVTAELKRREERARKLQETIERGRAALEKDRLDAARAAVDEVLALEKTHAGATALAQAIDERLAAKRRAEEEATRAREVVAAARQRFAAGEHDAAIAMLKDHTPAHALVDTAKSALEMKRREIVRRQEDERRALEERKRVEEERKRLEEQRRLEAERRAEEKRKQEEEARQRLEEQRRLEAERRAEEKRKQEEEERKRVEERKREAEERKRVEEERRLQAEQQAQEERRRAEEARAQAAAAAAAAAAVAAAAEEEERRRRQAHDDDTEKVAAVTPADAEEKTLVLTAADVAELTGDAPAAVPSPAADQPAPVSEPPIAPGVAATAAAEPAVVRPAPPATPEPVVRPTPPAARDAAVARPATKPTAPASSSRLSPAVMAAIAAVAVLVIGGIYWLMNRGPGDEGTTPPPAATLVSVFIDVRPWAAVESVVLKSDSKPVDVSCPATPCLVSLPPGEYRVRARNPFFQNPLEFDLTVAGGPYQEVRHTLPDLDPEEEARRLFGGSTR